MAPTAAAEGGPFAAYRPRRHRQWDVRLAIAAGGGLGSAARYGVTLALPMRPGGFPWPTFLVNVTGSLLLGFLMVLVVDVRPPTRYVRPFWGVGILGGYTTFSAFVAELRGLTTSGHPAITAVYGAASLSCGLAAVWTGVVVARAVASRPIRRMKGAFR
jgi:CrcB protein